MKNKNNIPDEVVFELTKSGWMLRETFLAYLLKQFVPKLKELKVVFPVVLFCDGVSSHISYDIISKQIIDSTVFFFSTARNMAENSSIYHEERVPICWTVSTRPKCRQVNLHNYL